MNIKLKLFTYLILISVSSLSFADDTDGDGIDDSIDNCVSVSNADQVDTDSDGIGNACDADDDGDNVIDSQDAFPLDRAYSKDSDNDQIPDKYEIKYGLNHLDGSDAELDIDNDGLTALDEFGFGTDHRLKDTDRDTLPDNWELLNDRDPLKPDYTLTDSCFVGDGVNMCWASHGAYSFVDKDNLIFDELHFAEKVYCGISTGDVHCWSDESNLSEQNGLWLLDVPNFADSIIDIDITPTYACALTESKRVVCWGAINDQDVDGIIDIDDVCTQFPSANQNDQDGDGLGDECDADADGDGIIESETIRSLDDVNAVIINSLASISFSQSFSAAFSYNDKIELPSGTCAVGGFAFAGDIIIHENTGWSKYGNEKFLCWGYRAATESVENYGVDYFLSLEKITGYAAMNFGRCAISDGEVVCVKYPSWVNNKEIAFTEMPDLTNPVRIVSNAAKVCALHDGGLSCWGDQSPVTNFPTLFTGLDKNTEVVGWGNTVCINRPKITCWGDDTGNRLTASAETPTGYRSLDWESPGLMSFQGYPSYLCAADDSVSPGNGYKKVKCWGGTTSNWGRSDFPNQPNATSSNPFNAPDGSSIVALSVGSVKGCVILKFDDNRVNELKCFGNTYGVTSYDFLLNVDNPIQVQWRGRQACVMSASEIFCGSDTDDNNLGAIVFPDQLFNATKLTVSDNHVCILEQRGVFCWGDNSYGQSNTVPLLNPSDIYASSLSTCALHDLGVKCWGQRDFEYESSDIRGKIGALSSSELCINDGGTLKCGLPTKLEPFRFYSFDPDGDGFHAWEDDFPLDALETGDFDGDGIGDNADTDDDSDGIPDDEDSMPFDTDNDGLNNNVDDDDDNDGILDINDGGPLDTDNDTLNNDIDTDDDNDGYPDDVDEMPLDFFEHLDTDGDGIGNNADTDDDGDGLGDDYDTFPLDASEQVDTDSDGIGDNADNCPNTSNADQLNSDDDSLGNACDTDDDNDGVADTSDAFPLDAAEADDTDSDGIGNNADTDDDGDGVSDTLDVFPLDSSETIDTDLDGIGNNADTDDDGDNVPDSSDAFPLNASEWADTDLDGLGNNADTDDDGDGVADDSDAFPLDVAESVDTDSDGIGNNADTDDDGDTYADNVDVFPLDSAEWLDTDSDGTGNNADTDDDNDGVLDGSDAFPLDASESIDTDSDGVGNNADTDDDGDSVLDVNDAFPLDSTESVDTDSDGIGNNTDLDDDNDGVSDTLDDFPLDGTEWVDTDVDGIGNNEDADDDNDGIPDTQEIEDGTDPLDANSLDTDRDGIIDSLDLFPLDSTEWSDSDSDGIGNNADTDDDNDGVSDSSDAFPLDSTETVDTDSDGIGNNADTDDDGDGVDDLVDVYPLNSLYSKDSDLDGMPDAWEIRYGLDPNDPSDATSDQDNDGVTALDEFLAGTIPSGSIDLDGNERYDALTDGLLLLRGMFGLDGSALVTGTIASDALYTESVDIEARVAILGDLADIDGNGEIDALTDGLLTLRYLFGLQGDTLINGVVAGDATRKTAEEIEAHLETLMPAL
jgi:hypothetical protein